MINSIIEIWKISNKLKGRKISDEHKKIISDKFKGDNNPMKNKENIIKIKKINTIKRYYFY